ncbi:MAG: hypothetical protein ACQEP7_05700 [bacterium]
MLRKVFILTCAVFIAIYFGTGFENGKREKVKYIAAGAPSSLSNPIFGSSSKTESSKRKKPKPDSTCIVNYKVQAVDSGHLKVQVTTYLDEKSEGSAHVSVRPQYEGKGNRLFFEDSEEIEPGYDTVVLSPSYNTRSPQLDLLKERQIPVTLKTEKLKFEIYSVDNRIPGGGSNNLTEKTINYPYKWKIFQSIKPSPVIPDTTAVNSVSDLRMFPVAEGRVRIRFDYTYLSDHGPEVSVAADCLRLGEDVTGGYMPGDLYRGHGTEKVEVSGRKEKLVTDQVKISPYISGEHIFQELNFFHPYGWGIKKHLDKKWHGDRQTAYLNLLKKKIRKSKSFSEIDPLLLYNYYQFAKYTEGEKLWEWLYGQLTSRFREELARDKVSYEIALKLLLKIKERKPQPARRQVKKMARRLFESDRFERPVFAGDFSPLIFRRLKKLLAWLGMEDQIGQMEVDNIMVVKPDKLEFELDPDKFGRSLFFHFPTDYYIEGIKVRKQAATPGTAARYIGGDYYRKDYKERLNRFVTHGYRSVLGSEPDTWVEVRFPAADYFEKIKLEFIAFKKPKGVEKLPRHLHSYKNMVLTDRTLAQKVEWNYSCAEAGNNYRLVQQDFRKNNNRTNILEAVWLLGRKNIVGAQQALSNLEPPFGSFELKLLQKYDLLPVVFSTPGEALSFRQRERKQRTDTAALQQLMKWLGKFSSKNRYARYLLARAKWFKGDYRQALSNFNRLRSLFEQEDILWEEIILYNVSCLDRLDRKQEAIKLLEKYLTITATNYTYPFYNYFVEVEGNFTRGLAQRYYLQMWWQKLKNNKSEDWHKIIGFSKVKVPLSRYPVSEKEGEPVAKFLAGVLKKQTGALQGAVNHYRIGSGLASGPIRKNELFLLFPFNNDLYTITSDQPEIDPGFSGKQIKREVDKLNSRKLYMDSLTRSGELNSGCLESIFSSEKEKNIIVLSQFLFERLYSEINFNVLKRTSRDVLLEYIKNQGTIVK